MAKFLVKIHKRGSAVASVVKVRKKFPYKHRGRTITKKQYLSHYRKRGFRLVSAKSEKTLMARLVKKYAD